VERPGELRRFCCETPGACAERDGEHGEWLRSRRDGRK
jgi:hypothetical protein